MAKSRKKPYRKDVYKAFIEWSSLPKSKRRERGIATAKQFAKKYGIGEDRLSKWKKRSDYKKAVEEHMVQWMSEQSGDVWHAFMDKLKKYGRRNEMELYLLYVEGWSIEAARIASVEKAKTPKLEADDIRTLISELPEAKQQKYYEMLADLILDVQEVQDRFYRGELET